MILEKLSSNKAMTVPLPRAHGGDPVAIPIHPHNRNQETRNPTDPHDPASKHDLPTNPTQLDTRVMYQIKAQAREAIQTSQDLRRRLGAVRARLKILIEEEHKEPPDPGPCTIEGESIAVVKPRFDEAEKLQKTAEVMDEQTFKELNQGIKRKKVGCRTDPISTGFAEGKNPQQSCIPATITIPVHIRCLCLGLIASGSNMGGPEEGGNGRSPVERDESFRKRAGKAIAGSSSEAKNIVIVNMAEARQAMRARFLAVGLFLSVLLANSQQVIEHMRRVWKIRGTMEANPLEAGAGQRKFILEFSEEGDRNHVVRGGPWQYKGDAFIVEGLEVGADPATALFTHIPMWVQFRNIPFYLLTKKLARELGDQVGTLIKIDNNARGNICDKFLRARIQLPLFLALQKEITLMDELTDERVEVQIRYERIPNFCVFCGYIGHMEARCDAPPAGRRISFSQELRVRPVHFEDPRTWFLPEAMGQQTQDSLSTHTPMPSLWRTPVPDPAAVQAPWPAPWTGIMPATGGQRTNKIPQRVEEVAHEVARLTVNDAALNLDPNIGFSAGVTINDTTLNLDTNNGLSVVAVVVGEKEAEIVVATSNDEPDEQAPNVDEANADVPRDTQALDINTELENATGREVVTTNDKDKEVVMHSEASDTSSNNKQNMKAWKRKERTMQENEKVQGVGKPWELLKQGKGRV